VNLISLRIQYIFNTQAAKRVSTFQIEVSTLGGESLVVTMDTSDTVKTLKKEIEEREGTDTKLQELFVLPQPGVPSCYSNTGALDDDMHLNMACKVVLCVKLLPSWDSSTPAIRDSKIYKITGPSGCTATYFAPGVSYENFITVATPAMKRSTGCYYISFRVNSTTNAAAYLGVVTEGADCGKHNFEGEYAWGISVFDGSLNGSGKRWDAPAGNIGHGKVLTLELDTDEGTRKHSSNVLQICRQLAFPFVISYMCMHMFMILHF
jgi:hypothetical protein